MLQQTDRSAQTVILSFFLPPRPDSPSCGDSVYTPQFFLPPAHTPQASGPSGSHSFLRCAFDPLGFRGCVGRPNIVCRPPSPVHSHQLYVCVSWTLRDYVLRKSKEGEHASGRSHWVYNINDNPLKQSLLRRRYNDAKDKRVDKCKCMLHRVVVCIGCVLRVKSQPKAPAACGWGRHCDLRRRPRPFYGASCPWRTSCPWHVS